MKFNYFIEKNKFEEEWAELRTCYELAGMKPDAIEAMYEYDWDRFKAERVEALHTQEITLENGSQDDYDTHRNVLPSKYTEKMSADSDSNSDHSRFWWIEQLSSRKLLEGIRNLTSEELELLMLYYLEGYTQKECAERLGLSQSTINYRLGRIIFKIKK